MRASIVTALFVIVVLGVFAWHTTVFLETIARYVP